MTAAVLVAVITVLPLAVVAAEGLPRTAPSRWPCSMTPVMRAAIPVSRSR